MTKKLKKKKKKKVRRTEDIFRYLMKGAYNYDLPLLSYHPNTTRRRGAYNRFIDKLKLVLSGVKETRRILKNPAKPRKPKEPNANKALFQAICAKVDSHLAGMLLDLQSTKGEDGFEALIMLRNLFADIDDIDFQQNTYNAFCTVTLQPSESVFAFSKRFQTLYRGVVSSGKTINERIKIRYYLHALREHKDMRVLVEVKDRL